MSVLLLAEMTFTTCRLLVFYVIVVCEQSNVNPNEHALWIAEQWLYTLLQHNTVPLCR